MRLAGWICLAVCAAGCRTAPDTAAEAPDTDFHGTHTPPAVTARRLMDVCWPFVGDSPARVRLTFVKEGDRLKDVIFETSQGASNAIGRCAREIAWAYPWQPQEMPDAMEIGPPPVRPSGWTELAYITLLSEQTYTVERGILNPAPLVRACLSHGQGMRTQLRFRIQTNPVRVSTFEDTSAISDPHQRSTQADDEGVLTDSERCVQAVLASTVYPGTRPFEFDFSDLAAAPAPASEAEVAPYFVPAGVSEIVRALEPSVAHSGIASVKSQVAACWDQALQRRSGLSGARTLRIHVNRSGRVSFAQVVGSVGADEGEAVDYLLDRCLITALQSAAFVPPDGGEADFAYAWNFARRTK